jgi:sterol desaturase/sphingolipid hydroxylase (fatty acid hydroxylase superfamily)
MLGPGILVFVGAVVALERVWPAVRRPLLALGHVQDLAYLILYAVAVVPLIVIIDGGFAGALTHVAPWVEAPHLAVVPRLVLLAVALVLMDGCNWLAHWANHRWAAVWRFHAVHHSQEELSVLTSFRAHPLVHASFLVSVIPVVVLSSSVALPATAVTAYICLSSLPHANLRWSFGPLGKVVVSPAYHRLHHATEGRIDVNLGTVLTVWDVLTDRAVFPVRGAEPNATGLAGRPVPVEQEGPDHRPIAVLGVQLTEPFVAPPYLSPSPPSTARPSESGARR